MAKWGEGDPRWIVEERADATNVNNWHWTEKNATGWSKDKLKTLLEGLCIEDDTYCCEIKEVTKCDGEATANNRKAKLIFFYEWELTGEWKGNRKGSSNSYKGKFEIPNLSEENDASEVDVNVTVKSEKDEAYKIKEFMRKTGQERIREQVALYIKQLKEEFSKGIILPNEKATANTAKQNQDNKMNTVRKDMEKAVISPSSNTSVGVKIKCKTVTEKEEFKCEVGDLYQALTERERVVAFTRGNVQQFEAEKGERFVLFDGNIQGEFTELVHNKRIGMRWRVKSWPDEHYSDVTLTFEEKNDCTVLHLSQTGVPEKELERTREGWERYYWDSIRQTFGFGARLY